MSVVDPYAQYFENQIKTATPGKLLVMTCDAGIKFLRAALDGMKKRELDEQSANTRRAQNVLLELMNSINHSADQQLAANLDSLYTYMFDRLTHANIQDDEAALNEVMMLLSDLRSAWADAELTVRKSTKQTNPIGRVAA